MERTIYFLRLLIEKVYVLLFSISLEAGVTSSVLAVLFGKIGLCKGGSSGEMLLWEKYTLYVFFEEPVVLLAYHIRTL